MYDFSTATQRAYSWWQYDLCDVFIELMKPVMGRDEAADPAAAADKAATRAALCAALDAGLRLLHPFMPFVTEELWQRLPKTQAEVGGRDGGGGASVVEGLLTAREGDRVMGDGELLIAGRKVLTWPAAVASVQLCLWACAYVTPVLWSLGHTAGIVQPSRINIRLQRFPSVCLP